MMSMYLDVSCKGQPVIAAKYMPILWTKVLIGGPWRAGRRAVAKALSNTLERGGWGYVDLYQASQIDTSKRKYILCIVSSVISLR